MHQSTSNINSTQIVIPCDDLDETLDFFVEQLGFRLEMIMPADSPSVAVISGYGVNLRLETTELFSPPSLRLIGDFAEEKKLIAPNGMWIDLIQTKSEINLPDLKEEFLINRIDDLNAWKAGRANMQYRDLIPSRLGGRFIASHIRIPVGGEVPDYVHYHKVRFQMIFCKTGWAKLVYEDQGEPFIFQAGDCVLQPPEIRHRVLEASDGLEVIEIGTPAIHETFREHEITLPTTQVLPERVFNGQKFVHHIASEDIWELQENRFEFHETGILNATNGLADVRILRAKSKIKTTLFHQGECLFMFVLSGEMKVGDDLLKVGDCCV
ncbi:MAG: cupin domain-containing protein, partial [Acidobacteriota bacterium]